jgi:hypothetical protein
MTDLDGIESWPVIDLTGEADVQVPALATWPGIEMVAVGEWQLSTGPANFTSADLAQACAAARCPAVGQPIIKLGHHDPRFDGEPAIGWVANMRLNDTQTKLAGDFTGMPGWLAAILPSAYPERSIEGCWDFTCQIGHVHPFVITAVALLGVTPPGVGAITSLNDVAALYGIDPPAEPVPAEPAAGAARPRTFRILATPGETTMPPQTRPRPADAAGVVPTVDDIRREYYEDADWSEWIVEVQITSDGLVLIVIDDTGGELKRVPVDLSEAGKIKFGEDVPVLVSYVDAPPSAEDEADDSETVPGGKVAMPPTAAAFPPGRKVAASWGTRAASRDGMPGRSRVTGAAIASHTTATGDGAWDGPSNEANLDNGDGAAEYRAAYAWIDPDADADTKAAYRFIHHFVAADGTVGDASTVACSAGIGVLNGGRGGTSIPDADVQGVYGHLSKHISDSGGTPPELTAAAGGPTAAAAAVLEPDPDVEGGMRHGPYTGEHEHPHAGPADDGDLHMHPHRHNNDGRHDTHGHDTTEGSAAPAAPTEEGADDMQLSEDTIARVRAALGLADTVEVTEAHLADLASRQAPPPASAGVIDTTNPETPVLSEGTYLVDAAIIQDWRNRALAGDEAVRTLTVRERDTILAAAVVAGKFPQSRLEHYEAMWDKDPDGARHHVESLAAGLVPIGGPLGRNPGYDPDLPGDFDSQAAYKALYGPDEPAARR